MGTKDAEIFVSHLIPWIMKFCSTKCKPVAFMEMYVLQFIVSYLENRKQFVELKGIKSQVYFLSHGVPQGSLVGPRLFSIWVNDFKEGMSNRELHLYSDNTTAFLIGNSGNQVIQLLNALLKEIIQCCRVNKLTIHSGKCETMFIRRQKSLSPF